MDTVQKISQHFKVVQKSLKLANQHLAALQAFERNYPSLKFDYESKPTLQLASQTLLDTPGINKNILGIQSIFAQNAEFRKSVKFVPDEMIKAQQKLSTSFKDIFEEKDKMIQRDFCQAMEAIDNRVALDLERTMKTIREYTSQEIISQHEFLKKISEQTLFVAKLQPNLPKIEPLFANLKIIESTIIPRPLIKESLSVAIETLNFSFELDKLTHEEQLKILDYLENLDINDETELIIPDDLPEEIQSDYITLVEFLRNFWKTNKSYIIGILTTVETAVKNFSENDFSNPFTVIAFIYNCVALLLKQINDDKNEK